MTEKIRRRILWNSFLYTVALSLALKVLDISKTAVGFSKPLYIFVMVLGWICALICAFWTVLFIRDMVRSGRLDGIGTDKNLMATFFLYVLTILIFLLFKAIKIKFGPIPLPGKESPSVSFPSGHVLLFMVSIGSTVYHVWDLFDDRGKLPVIISAVFTLVLLLGIIAAALCGIYWFTDILGGLLLGVMLLMLYSFFFFV